MKLKLILLAGLFLCLGQSSKDERFEWRETRKLKWVDFKRPAQSGSDAAAMTSAGITFGYSLRQRVVNGPIIGFNTDVKAYFYPQKSWVKKGSNTPYILSHEQLHFDLTELYVRKFRKRITELELSDNIKAELKELQIQINKELNEEQFLYDIQTNHSIRKDAQAEWSKKIKAELKEYEAFKSK
ncbi:DUF922 domain-containing protein [Winogradskyella maritima]|uniref:DUF922 domain-containing protein n=1 Tax=Winogradskyella maritima TaxID=1517766 RepID=A0ABV8AK33_9FLAO|nr:DUF922 domain-containing protein [Winogradskyella maritima]